MAEFVDANGHEIAVGDTVSFESKGETVQGKITITDYDGPVQRLVLQVGDKTDYRHPSHVEFVS